MQDTFIFDIKKKTKCVHKTICNGVEKEKTKRVVSPGQIRLRVQIPFICWSGTVHIPLSHFEGLRHFQSSVYLMQENLVPLEFQNCFG